MAASEDMITFIRKQCGDFPNNTAEAMIYGIARILNMTPLKRKFFWEKAGYQGKEPFSADYGRVLYVFRRYRLDRDLILSGAPLVLPFFTGEEAPGFLSGLTQRNRAGSFGSIVYDVIFRLDEVFRQVFKSGNTLQTVEEYAKKLKEMENDAEVLYVRTDGDGEDPLQEMTGKEGEVPFEELTDKDDEDPFEEMTDEDVMEIFEATQENEDSDQDRWKSELWKLKRRLNMLPLVGQQIEAVSSRAEVFVKELTERGQNELLRRFFYYFFSEENNQRLAAAFQEYRAKGTNDTLANYKAAGHLVMRGFWNCFEDCRERLAESSGRLMFLSKKYADAYDALTKKVIGQDYAVNEFIRACFDAELYETAPGRPQGVFLFAGPPGVGKTFLASNVAELLHRPLKIFDMASYSIEKSDLALIGVEPGFRNATEGTLVAFVEDHPDAIIVLDEIEKAHPDVIKLFLSVLDGARLENKLLSSNTDFSHTILIFTTNAGRAIYEDNNRNLSATPTDVIIKELRKEKGTDNQPKFPPEMCSRFASRNIVMFNHIGISDMLTLITMRMDASCREIEKKLNVSVEYDSRIALLLLMHFGNIDVRVITNQAQQFIRKEIYELARQMSRMQASRRVRTIRLSIDDTRISLKAKKFFSAARNEEVNIVLVCDEKYRRFLKEAASDRIRLQFIESQEKLAECDLSDITAVIVDPYYEMRRVDDRILGLDDYDSVGLRIIKELLQKTERPPVYLLEGERKVSRTDKNTLYMRGVEDTVFISEASAAGAVSRIAEEHILQKKCRTMLKRRKIFDFESLQVAPDKDGTVNIRFYDIVVKDAVNAEDSDMLINIEERPNVKFDDVIGAANAKAELGDFVRFLENPKKYLQNAPAVPKGILLYGPPGTGKTMLARALAGETDAAFISVSAAGLRSKGESGIERLFTTARKYAPAIIFIDEVDAIARRRTGTALSSSYEEALLNMLLTQMDGVEEQPGTPVFVVAATNFGVDVSPDPLGGGLDPAFLRRFGNKILIDQPNKAEKIQFLSRRLARTKAKGIRNNVTEAGIRNIAERTPGESIATLENILELAFRNAARKGEILNDELLDEAMEEYFYGEKRDKDERRMYRTAVHEASHAYIYTLSGKKPAYLTVISRGSFGGYMQKEDEENKGTVSREECIWSIRTSLAGRAGEMVIFGDAEALNTGAAADLRNASRTALNMLTAYGMEDGHLFTMPYEYLQKSGLLPLYVERAETIMREQEKICREMIEQGKDTIIALAKALVEKNHLNQTEIEEILGKKE